MYIGSFHRVATREEIDRRVPLCSCSSIILVEDEKKLYEKNIYGIVSEYPVAIEPKENTKDFTAEITDFENRLYDLEQKFQKLGGNDNYEI